MNRRRSSDLAKVRGRGQCINHARFGLDQVSLKELVEVELVSGWCLVILVVFWLLNSVGLMGCRRHLTRYVEAGFGEDTSAGAADRLVACRIGAGLEHRTLAALFGTHDGLR